MLVEFATIATIATCGASADVIELLEAAPRPRAVQIEQSVSATTSVWPCGVATYRSMTSTMNAAARPALGRTALGRELLAIRARAIANGLQLRPIDEIIADIED